MKGGRQPWMTRAAVLIMLIGLTIAAWTVFVVWAYREVRPIAPDWLIGENRRWPRLDTLFMAGWMMIGAVWAIGLWVGLSRILGIPKDAAWTASDPETYPFHKRKLSRRARTQAGQEGFVTEATDRFARFAQNPMTPPVRERRPKTD